MGKEKKVKEPEYQVFSIAADNAPVPGCTVSRLISELNSCPVFHFSLARRTSISPESYPVSKLWVVASGNMDAVVSDVRTKLKQGDLYVTPVGVPVGTEAEENCVYTEITLTKETVMNEIIKAGEVFALKDLLPIQKDRIVNMNLISDDKVKFALMSFDEGTGLTEHAAPGEALVFALEGKGIIGYEGKEYPISAGQNFKFAKNGAHYVKADGPFKMALLLMFE